MRTTANPVAPALRFFCPCPRGLEGVLATELTHFGASGVTPVAGGVACEGQLALGYRVNLHSRIASRALLEVARRNYKREADLLALAREQRWEKWFEPTQTLRVDTTAIRSPLRSLHFATLTVKDGIVDRFRDRTGSRPSIDTARPDVRVFVFLTDREVTLYLDLSGEPLFKRGWRHHRRGSIETAGTRGDGNGGAVVDGAHGDDEIAEINEIAGIDDGDAGIDPHREDDADEDRAAHGLAPLKENLAAGLLALADWSPAQPLLDPFCGAGTILIEAAQIATARPPGLARRFAIEKLKIHNASQWQTLVDRARLLHEEALATSTVVLRGSDIDPAAITMARANLLRAGLPADRVRFDCVDAREVGPDGARAGQIIANPPYGERLEVDPALWTALGARWRADFGGWRASLLWPDKGLPGLLGLREDRRTPLFNGAIECRLFGFGLRERHERPERPGAPPR